MGFVEDIIQASKRGTQDVIWKLVSNNLSSINQADSNGNTAIFWACRESKADILQLLLSAGADVNIGNKSGDLPLTISAGEGDSLIVNLLLQSASILINKPDKKGWTALICASYHGHVDVAQLLLNAGADINLTSNVGCTGLATMKK